MDPSQQNVTNKLNIQDTAGVTRYAIADALVDHYRYARLGQPGRTDLNRTSMPSFLIYFAHDSASIDSEKALQQALLEAGFFDTIVGSNRITYRLPPLVYHSICELTKDQILDRAKRIALRTGKQCAIMVTECADTAWVGLEMLGRESAEEGSLRATTIPAAAEIAPAVSVTAARSKR